MPRQYRLWVDAKEVKNKQTKNLPVRCYQMCLNTASSRAWSEKNVALGTGVTSLQPTSTFRSRSGE